jgi:hypothetical protein
MKLLKNSGTMQQGAEMVEAREVLQPACGNSVTGLQPNRTNASSDLQK